MFRAYSLARRSLNYLDDYTSMTKFVAKFGQSSG